MVGIKESDRDFLCFLWFKQPELPYSDIIHLRLTRGHSGCSHKSTFGKCKEYILELVCKIESSLYVDVLVKGANSLSNAIQFYEVSKRIMVEAGMNLRTINYLSFACRKCSRFL